MAEKRVDQEERVSSSPPSACPGIAPIPVRWLDENQQEAWRALVVMHARLGAALAAQLAADSELSFADYVVLVDLTEGEEGTARVHELARHLGWERSRVSHHIARMAERGLVRKERCAVDRRGSFVTVTEDGRRAIEAAAPGHVAAARRFVIDVLTDEQLDALAYAAGRVTEAIDRAEGVHPGDE